MAKVKWRSREFNPTENMGSTHSFYAEAVISSDLSNDDIADRIQARTGFKAYEVKAVIGAWGEVVLEELLESNRISIADTRGTKILSIYPKVSGSVTDEDILRETTAAHAADPSVPIRNKAEESDLTPDRLTWTLGSTMGVKFSKQFAMNKQAQKVKVTTVEAPVAGEVEGGETPTPETPDPGNGGGGGGNNNGGVDQN